MAIELDDLVGNKTAVAILKLMADYGRLKGPMRHIGLFGEHGNGKTTMAIATARRIGRKYCYLNGTAVKTPEIFRRLLVDMDIGQGAVVFIDEAHALTTKIQDSMLSLLNRPGTLVTDLGDQILRENLPDKVSFILATNEESKLNTALVSRLQRVYLNSYSLAERMQIAKRWFERNGEPLEAPIAAAIARRSRSGRDVESNCMLIVELAEVRSTKITSKLAYEALNMGGYDLNGLGAKEKAVLNFLGQVGKAGLHTIAAAVEVDADELSSIIEPWLLKQQLLMKHKTGRLITEKGRLAIQGKPIAIC